MVRRGEADVAAVDCVSHALYARYEPQTIAGTRVLAETRPAPGLPYVSRGDAGPDLQHSLRAGLHRAAAEPDLAETRAALLLDGFVDLTLDHYAEIVAIEDEAVAAGLPALV
jgi:ABC-type phosphate/phosphonate transport system substrate-binding protein